MSFIESLKMALSSLKAHKMRSILTMIGIIIGVGSVIIVVAIGQGGEAMLKSQLTGPGNTMDLFYQPSEEEMLANPNSLYESAFSQEDIRAIEQIPEVKRVVASSLEFGSVSYLDEQAESTLMGVNSAYFELNPPKMEDGRNFSSADFLGGRRVAIVSYSLQEELFDDKSAVGEVIRIGGAQPVEIIGVLEKPTGIFSFGSLEVYIPTETWLTIYGSRDISTVTLQAESADDLQIVGEKAANLMNQRYNTEDSYQVINMEEIAEGIGQITKVMTLIISSIAGISLFVGGIGVMNIMLVSVTERTREIGIRKALGATRAQVLTQFLIESVTLTLIGGLIGIGLGWGVTVLIGVFAGWPSLMSWQVVLGGMLFSMLIGVVFGILPASKASKLDPIESLRYE
ncbi:antimicrobial peptide resistance transport system permease protein [Cytobacillus horneckiae]|uniref:Macrolide ABC transporter permease n=1 Tax=Cytobacillus horneckiae TaxID=549687 RepID=A0A2N0ZGB0_9BACI|nr:ABC transporter permease [Cytobacillus horneckiae]MBN6886080.1 ABC transporter permease [Cytobacillus horneckiae]MCM3176384.1 ABC transporter permease [Cytobacillus horneckiae]MEC1155782.1 ABC transporter permease [Cytobacillus horneckiae]MED2939321.1 ABC transporter permease [Cytobacillus horneckiae]PKG28545.1 macrolide ABC transporter permease [Cytobacillus horneckiae]